MLVILVNCLIIQYISLQLKKDNIFQLILKILIR